MVIGLYYKEGGNENVTPIVIVADDGTLIRNPECTDDTIFHAALNFLNAINLEERVKEVGAKNGH